MEATSRKEGAATRAHVWILAILAMLLVVDGPSRSAAGEAQGAPLPALALTAPEAETIARKLAEVNPELAEVELRRIAAAVVRYSGKYDLDPALVTAVLLVESSARPWARSPKGAQGLMQVMPYMMEPLGLAGNASTIETNIEAGCMILAGNIRRLGEEDGISAYFWGSDIRGVAYLNRVRAAREKVRREIRS